MVLIIMNGVTVVNGWVYSVGFGDKGSFSEWWTNRDIYTFRWGWCELSPLK